MENNSHLKLIIEIGWNEGEDRIINKWIIKIDNA